jgi:nucleoid-associated protein YgaU
MRAWRVSPLATIPLAVLLGGCGYVHLGKLPEPTTTVIGDDKLMRENSDLRSEKKILQQELALTRAQGDALRMAIENRAADGDTSKRLADKLTETSRELAMLRANYAKLQTERDSAFANASDATALRTKLGAAEDKLAESLRTYTSLQDEIGRLKSEVDKTRSENLALTEQVRTVTAQNEQAQAAVAQLNTQLLAQKEARARAEQDSETLRSQIASSTGASALAQLRNGSAGAAGETRSLATEQAKEIISLRQDLDNSRAKLTALESERAELKQQLASSAPAPEFANVQAKLASAAQENAQLKSAKSTLETQLAQLQTGPVGGVDALRAQLRDAQAQAQALTAENAQLKSRLANALTGRAERATNRTTGAEPVRLNLDAPPPAPRTIERAAPIAATETPAPTVAAEETEHAPAPRTSTSNPVTRPNGSGVSATLVTSASGARSQPPALPQGRIHVVAGGDTLSKISALYYGTPTRWGDILAANRDILGENNNLVIGRSLRIP